MIHDADGLRACLVLRSVPASGVMNIVDLRRLTKELNIVDNVPDVSAA